MTQRKMGHDQVPAYEDDEPLRPHTRGARAYHHHHHNSLHDRRPLIEQITNAWRDDEKGLTSKHELYHDSEDDEEGHEIAHCCDLDSDRSFVRVLQNIFRSRKYRRTMIATVVSFIAFICLWKFYLQPRHEVESILKGGFNYPRGTFGIQHSEKFPDIIQVQQLPAEEIPGGPSDPEGKKRLIFIGDIHGCHDQLLRLLDKVEHNDETDRIIAVGDVIAKGPNTPAVIDTLIRHKAYSVRGNHEDRVLLQSGSWQYSSTVPDSDSDSSLASSNHGAGLKGPDLLPYLKHRHMTWLRSLPLILHIPALTQPRSPPPPQHLPSDTPTDKKNKPLKHALSPILSDINIVHGGLVPAVPLARQDPYAVMHMRSIMASSHAPSERRDRGVPWELIWGWYSERVSRGKRVSWFSWFAEDYEDEGAPVRLSVADETDAGNSFSGRMGEWVDGLWGFVGGRGRRQGRLKPERLSTVVYGHDSPRGLNLHRWTKGLDSGCVGGGRLTAMVLDAWGRVEIVSVSCEELASKTE